MIILDETYSEQYRCIVKDLKRDAEGKLMGDDFDDVFQNDIQAINIAIEAIEDSDNRVELYEKAFETVLNDYLAPELVKKIIREITLEFCRRVSQTSNI